ncbi:ankyrin repeat-containing domain protein [Annulohypoxylon bovei var. microspora]|nr:ankyrin repeat-containing domain protein [Annulohypoxylon bovei var. microspora]
MAPPARHISQEEWNTHEREIRDLYHKLPLLNDKGEPCVVQVMEDQHEFSASAAQYETKFREWGLTKNLKKREWEQLISQYDELREQEIEARIMIWGSVVGERKLKRARRLYASQPHNGIFEGNAIPPTRQAFVELRDNTGSWSRYSGSGSAARSIALTQSLDHQNIDAQDDSIASSLDESRPIQISSETGEQQRNSPTALVPWQGAGSPTLSHEVQTYPGFSSPMSDSFLQLSRQIVQNQDHSQWNGQYFNNDDFPNSWYFQPEASFLDAGIQDASLDQRNLEFVEISAHGSSSLGLGLGTRPKVFATVLLQHAKQLLQNNVAIFEDTGLPDVEDIVDSLESLLPGRIDLETMSSESGTIERNANFGLGFKVLLYSIINGFAGLRNIPRGAILKLIRENHEMQTHLFKFLNSSPSSVAKPLADNLFRAAVESCDRQAVTTIMSITGRNPDTVIDPNEIACEFHGRQYTPVELAAKFRNFEIVQVLLAAKADPNKTYGENDESECGALELAVRKWGDYEPVDLKLVELLLDWGAEISIDLVEATVRWGHRDKELLQELLSRIAPSCHDGYLKHKYLLQDITKYLENSVTTAIIKRFFADCEETNCNKCASNYPIPLKDILTQAASRGNLDLVNFLLQYTKATQLALAAAVRSGNSQLIDILLDKGASVTGQGGFLHRVDTGTDDPIVDRPTTPLAEAIRAQDQSRIQDFEDRGAFACMTQIDHFDAAAYAAVESGDITRLKRILELAPAYCQGRLTTALNMAIYNDHTDVALALLEAGADVNNDAAYQGYPLSSALKLQNKRVVDVILECDLIANQYSYLEHAGLWGNVEIIEDLILMGADINAGREMTALGAAVKSRNEPLVHRLLELGAIANAPAENGSSPLEAAVKNGDHNMITFLISQGACVADTRALEYAMEHDLSIYNILLSAFKKAHPLGRKMFGGTLLIKFIEKNDIQAVDTLLEAKVDINSICWTTNKTPALSIHFIQRYSYLSPLGFAIQYKKGTCYNLVCKLLQAGGNTKSIAAELVIRTYDKSIGYQQTPLLLAVQTRKKGMVEILVNQGADVNRPARRGIKRTPLQQACESCSFDIVEFLLLKEANVNDPAAEMGGYTALQLAAISGSIKIAQLLLDNGADPHGAPSKAGRRTAFEGADPHGAPSKAGGRTAFEGAAENGCLNMLALLYKAASPVGFDQKEMQRARNYAEIKGHRGCVDYIDSLLEATSNTVSLLNFDWLEGIGDN